MAPRLPPLSLEVGRSLTAMSSLCSKVKLLPE